MNSRDMNADTEETRTAEVFFKDTHDFRHLHPHWPHVINRMDVEGTPSLLLHCFSRFLFLDNISYISVELNVRFNFTILFNFVLFCFIYLFWEIFQMNPIFPPGRIRLSKGKIKTKF